MTPFEKFIQFLINFSPALTIWFLVKILFLIGLAIYIAFAVIVIRQVNLMTQALNGSFDFPIKLVSWIHLGVAIAVFFLALVIL
jgi:hypothetical protein